MPTTLIWTNGNQHGRVEGGVHRVRLSDAAEIAAAINRRRGLAAQALQYFSGELSAEARVRASTLGGAIAPPFDDFRRNVCIDLLAPTPGALGGDPATPEEFRWLWTEADADEGKVIASGREGVRAGEVGLLQKLNASAAWTDDTLAAGETFVRAAHANELRQALEWLRRGRWTAPIYFSTGIISTWPDDPWPGELIANVGTDELRALGRLLLSGGDGLGHTIGLAGVTVRASSAIELTVDTNCTVDIYRCLRPVHDTPNAPTWDQYDPAANLDWQTPGGLGAADAGLIGSIALTADVPGQLSASALAAALQAMVDGQPPWFLIRRSDTGPESIDLTGRVVIEFDIATETT